MTTVRFGRTEIELPAVGLGTWSHGGPNTVHGRPVGWFGANEEDARATLVSSHRNGIFHWDTADVYGDGKAERIIGTVWREVPRDEIFLASKVGWDPGNHSHYYHPAQIRRQLDRSLRNLETDWIDLYYLHHCDFGPEGEYLEDALDLLHTFRDQGKIRFVGLSDWKCEAIVRYADLVKPDAVQCYRNVVDDSYESSGLKKWVEANDAGVAFFSPLKHSLLLGLFEGPVTFGEGDHRSSLPEFRDYGLLMRLQACRAELEKRFREHSEPVLDGLIGAILSDSATGVALVGQRSPEHVKSAARVEPHLDSESVQWIRQLYRENGRATHMHWKSYQQKG
ncbi:MAG: aldo/keto reductase [Holophagales bacterium]|nr:aldo/keto reductase [Holophagales bacterium]